MDKDTSAGSIDPRAFGLAKAAYAVGEILDLLSIGRTSLYAPSNEVTSRKRISPFFLRPPPRPFEIDQWSERLLSPHRQQQEEVKSVVIDASFLPSTTRISPMSRLARFRTTSCTNFIPASSASPQTSTLLRPRKGDQSVLFAALAPPDEVIADPCREHGTRSVSTLFAFDDDNGRVGRRGEPVETI